MTITRVPVDSLGGPDSQGVIAGKVKNFRAGDRIMVFAFTRKWWVQPDVNAERTPIQPDGTWQAHIHLGHRYAAALVRGKVVVKASEKDLPSVGDDVLAVVSVDGLPTEISAVDHTTRTLQFGGQEWDDTFHISEYGGRNHYYLPQNATVDDAGALHLHIRRVGSEWTCAEVNVLRGLGYGTYRMSFQNPDALEPAAEFSFFTMDTHASSENYREMDLHVSRWGDPRSKNAEYVLQPYYVPANVHRFEIPSGEITTVLKWSPGKAEFSTEHGGTRLTAWTFTANVPTPANGHVYLNLCPFGYPKNPLTHDVEVVVRDFEFLP